MHRVLAPVPVEERQSDWRWVISGRVTVPPQQESSMHLQLPGFNSGGMHHFVAPVPVEERQSDWRWVISGRVTVPPQQESDIRDNHWRRFMMRQFGNRQVQVPRNFPTHWYVSGRQRLAIEPATVEQPTGEPGTVEGGGGVTEFDGVGNQP
jgi:hypothetical protein